MYIIFTKTDLFSPQVKYTYGILSKKNNSFPFEIFLVKFVTQVQCSQIRLDLPDVFNKIIRYLVIFKDWQIEVDSLK